MKVSCPSCNSNYMIDDSKIPDKGATAVCKKCNNKIIIKKDLPELELEEAQSYDENISNNKNDFEKQSSVVDSDTKKCPYCAEVIQNEASKCKHCGSILKDDATKVAFTEKIISTFKSAPFNLTNFLQKYKPNTSKYSLKSLYPILGIVALIGISFGIISGSCSGNSELGLVKNGYLDFNKSLKFGKAIDKYKYFESTEWKYFVTDKEVKVVQITGKLKPSFFDAKTEINLRDKTLLSADVIIQCTLNSDGKSFKIAHISANVILKCDDYSIRGSSGKMSWIECIYDDISFDSSINGFSTIRGSIEYYDPYYQFQQCAKKL
jgi:predicted Zn finger-like uncharacterized protein